MQVRLGLFDEQQRQIAVLRPYKLQDDRGDVQQVRVAETCCSDVPYRHLTLGKLNTQQASDAAHLKLSLIQLNDMLTIRWSRLHEEALYCVLGGHGELMFSNFRKRRIRGLNETFLQVCIRAHQDPEDIVQQRLITAIEISYGVAQRGHVDVGDPPP